jgi:hypothetical protein
MEPHAMDSKAAVDKPGTSAPHVRVFALLTIAAWWLLATKIGVDTAVRSGDAHLGFLVAVMLAFGGAMFAAGVFVQRRPHPSAPSRWWLSSVAIGLYAGFWLCFIRAAMRVVSHERMDTFMAFDAFDLSILVLSMALNLAFAWWRQPGRLMSH